MSDKWYCAIWGGKETKEDHKEIGDTLVRRICLNQHDWSPEKKKINPQTFGEWKDSMQKDLDPVTSQPPTLERDVVAS